MRRVVVLFAVPAIAAAVWLGYAAHGGAAGGLARVQWLPSESWPGGKQHDARLDRRVTFWKPGIALPEVFAGIREQTGVEIGFWPPGDENERVRVNLFLNPDEPPTLRDVMAQLSWVLGCAFSYEPVEGGEPRYCLLSTSMRFGVERRLEAEQAEARRRVRELVAERQADNLTRGAEKLRELRDALSLSREEAIERYRGEDDALLLALLEEESRRTVEFALGLSRGDYETLVREGIVSHAWGEWSPQQQAALREILQEEVGRLRERGLETPAGAPDWQWTEGSGAQATVVGLSYGAIWVRAEVPYRADGTTLTAAVRGRIAPLISDGLMDGMMWNARHAADLREALGETVTQEERQAMHRQEWEARRARWEEYTEANARRTILERMESNPPLSPEAESRLTSFLLPVTLSTAYPLWQVQEVVAGATGMHVVSDCFSQPARSLGGAFKLLFPEESQDPTGMLVLKLMCVGRVEPDEWGRPLASQDEPSWEWDDAGQFLRFRSRARDLWRAAMLPQGVLSSIDEVVEPAVEAAAGESGAALTAVVELEPVWSSWLARWLDDLQLRHGGRMIYGDPTDADEMRAQIARQAALGAIAERIGIFRFLGALSEEQWERAWREGLHWRKDLTPEQQEPRISPSFPPEWRETGEMIIRLHETGTEGGSTVSRQWPGGSPMRRAGEVHGTFGLEVSVPRQGHGRRYGRWRGDLGGGTHRGAPGRSAGLPEKVSYPIPLPRSVSVNLPAPARLTSDDVVEVGK